jgi:hypothetical protein
MFGNIEVTPCFLFVQSTTYDNISSNSPTGTITGTISPTPSITPTALSTSTVTRTPERTPTQTVTPVFSPTSTVLSPGPGGVVCFYPNPAHSGQDATFLLTLDASTLQGADLAAVQSGASVTLDIFNLMGERICHLQLSATPGTNRVRWSTGSTPAGLYVYQLKIQGRKCGSGKLALLAR